MRRVEVLGQDVGVVQEAVGGVGGGAVASGRGNAVAGVVEGSLHDACGTPVQTLVSKVERVEVLCAGHPADLRSGTLEATYCTKFRRMRSAERGNEGRRPLHSDPPLVASRLAA